MKFLDSAKIYLKSGDGGNGAISFRREKFIEFGGPDGGNGGKGADIYIQTSSDLNTLIDFRYTQHFKGSKGGNGKGRNKNGAHAKDIIITVPVGTVILNEDKTEILYDLVEDNQKILLLKGGRGGVGNAHFKSSTNQAPRYAQNGTKGQEMWIWLELKLIADIGIIGLPNAGKSTLISTITNAKSKIDNYAFTTLIPHLGLLNYNDKSIVIADFPGLIQGASHGIGLGTKFLEHIKRCKAFIHLLDASAPDINKNYNIIKEELLKYNPELFTNTKQIIVFNKTDLIGKRELKAKLAVFVEHKVVCISALKKQGLEELLCQIDKLLEHSPKDKKLWSPI